MVMVIGLGLIIGSFLNVCIYRMPLGKSIAWPGSHCPHCKKAVAWFDNVPVLSFVWLKGKCRSCQKGISARYPFVELLSAAAVWLAWISWSELPYVLMGAVIFFALIVVIFIDLDHQIIPDSISLGGIAAGLVFSAFFYEWHGAHNWQSSLLSSGLGILVGGGSLLITALVAEAILKKEAMGGGDIKLLAAVGAFCGWPGAMMTLFLGSLSGSVAGLILKWIYKAERIPFGPYIALGAVANLLWGKAIVSWYLGSMLQY